MKDSQMIQEIISSLATISVKGNDVITLSNIFQALQQLGNTALEREKIEEKEGE